MSAKTCLILLPLHTKALRKRIVHILKSLHIKPLTAKDVFSPTYPVITKLQETIKKSDFVVADVTGANPNIMFEMGMCLGYGKPVVILARSDTKVPFDVHGLFIVEYDQTPKGLKRMEMSLKEKLSLLSLPEQVSPVDEYMSARSFLGFLKMPRARRTEDTNRFAQEILELPIDSKMETSVRFESLISELFENEGFNVVSTRKKLTDWPVDLVLQVAKQPGFLPVECKNVSVTSEDIARFSQLLDSRHLNTGIIMSSEEMTKDAKDRILRELKHHGILVIAFDRSDLQKVAQGEKFKKLLDAKTTNAALFVRLER